MNTTYILLDTCVWLSLAQDADALPMLTVLRAHVDAGSVKLLVPSIVFDEIERNQERICSQYEARLRTLVKHARGASDLLSSSEGSEMRKLADKAERQIQEKASTLAHALQAVKELLGHSTTIRSAPDASHSERVIRRALRKEAPFHRNKNSVADALLMEIFRDFVSVQLKDGNAFFVSENSTDYCDEKNKAVIHGHYADLFAANNISFSVNVAELIEKLGPFQDSEAAKVRYATQMTSSPEICAGGGGHMFSESQGAFLRSQFGGLTWQLFCQKCGARFDTGESWD